MEREAVDAVPIVKSERAEGIATSVVAKEAGPLYSTVVRRHLSTAKVTKPAMQENKREGGKECWG